MGDNDDTIIGERKHLFPSVIAPKYLGDAWSQNEDADGEGPMGNFYDRPPSKMSG